MVLGASSMLSQHLVAHPEQLDLLVPELARRSPRPSCARELLTCASEADPTPTPVATELHR